jgi:hypothetical protein
MGLEKRIRRGTIHSGRMDTPFGTPSYLGPDLFRHACLMGLEGIVSKHKNRPYRSGRSKDWLKVKNRTSPAMNRPEGMF